MLYNITDTTSIKYSYDRFFILFLTWFSIPFLNSFPWMKHGNENSHESKYSYGIRQEEERILAITLLLYHGVTLLSKVNEDLYLTKKKQNLKDKRNKITWMSSGVSSDIKLSVHYFNSQFFSIGYSISIGIHII